MQNTAVRKWLFLFFILLFPSLLYVVLSTGKHQIIRLPYFGPKEFVADDDARRVDTTFYKIPNFAFIDYLGNEISASTIANQTKVFSLVCAKCENSFSKRLLAEQAQLQLKLEKRTDLKFVTLIVDANNLDSLEFQAFIKNSNPNDNVWKIAVLDNKLAKTFAENSLLLDNYFENKGSSTFVLVDRNNHIRGYFNGEKYLEVKELEDAIKVLKAEEFIPKKNS